MRPYPTLDGSGRSVEVTARPPTRGRPLHGRPPLSFSARRPRPPERARGERLEGRPLHAVAASPGSVAEQRRPPMFLDGPAPERTRPLLPEQQPSLERATGGERCHWMRGRPASRGLALVREFTHHDAADAEAAVRPAVGREGAAVADAIGVRVPRQLRELRAGLVLLLLGGLGRADGLLELGAAVGVLLGEAASALVLLDCGGLGHGSVRRTEWGSAGVCWTREALFLMGPGPSQTGRRAYARSRRGCNRPIPDSFP